MISPVLSYSTQSTVDLQRSNAVLGTIGIVGIKELFLELFESSRWLVIGSVRIVGSVRLIRGIRFIRVVRFIRSSICQKDRGK